MSSLPRNLDLHLIRILYLLLVEKNVSRVALKLNQPQPSISASLRKLRELTGDPLLVRGARGMVPTQHGESLLKPAKRILDEAEEFMRQEVLNRLALVYIPTILFGLVCSMTVLRFYRLDEGLIERFYAARTTFMAPIG